MSRFLETEHGVKEGQLTVGHLNLVKGGDEFNQRRIFISF